MVNLDDLIKEITDALPDEYSNLRAHMAYVMAGVNITEEEQGIREQMLNNNAVKSSKLFPRDIKGVKYDSIREAVSALKLTRQRIYQIIKQEDKEKTRKENVRKGIDKRKTTIASRPKKTVKQTVFNGGTEFEYKGVRYKINDQTNTNPKSRTDS